jgi:hypothetical protein
MRRSLSTLISFLSFVYIAHGVFDGVSVDYSQFPFFATVIFQNAARSDTWLCGASLLNSTLLVTAGHCVAGAAAAFIYLNSSVWLNPYTPAQSFYSDIFILDPSYHGSLSFYAHDFSLVVLPFPVNTTEPLVPASADDWAMVSACETLNVIGRGETCAGGCLSSNLQYAQLPKIPRSSCVLSSLNHFSTEWYPWDIGSDLCLGYTDACAQSPPMPVSTCAGDSGGPLFVNNTLYGIVSRGDSVSCGQSKRASIFASAFETNNKLFLADALAGNLQTYQASSSLRNKQTFICLIPFVVFFVMNAKTTLHASSS